MTQEKTVLLVEEDLPLAKALAEVLDQNGYKTFIAGDEKKAVEIYRKKGDDLQAIVVDIWHPTIQGIEIAEFNDRNLSLPFVAFTSTKDSKESIKLMKSGVEHFIVKPVDFIQFLGVMENAIMRSINLGNGKGVNLNDCKGSLTIPSKLVNLDPVIHWLTHKVKNCLNGNSLAHFQQYTKEFLLNAHEHGNMGINEKEKVDLIISGEFENEILKRESEIEAKIYIEAILGENLISVEVRDEGKGFNYEKYFNMTEELILERMEMPSGRGIYMSTHYFDTITYSSSGSSVFLVKKFS